MWLSATRPHGPGPTRSCLRARALASSALGPTVAAKGAGAHGVFLSLRPPALDRLERGARAGAGREAPTTSVIAERKRVDVASEILAHV